MSIFTGSGVAIVTPFTKEGINYTSFEKLLEYQIKEGTDAIIVCGTTGEPSTMSVEEKVSVIQFAVEKVQGRIPVIAGTGGNNTKTVIELSQKAESLGVDALLIVTPYYNKTTQKGLVEHFNAIADAVHLPIIIYNVPSRTGLNMTPTTLRELAQHRNIQAMKEASGNITQIVEMARICNGFIDIYSGNDDHVVPVLSVGGKGVISVVANIAPKDMHNLVKAFLSGHIDESVKLQFKINTLVEVLFTEVNPIPIKTALNLIGFDVGELRLPLTSMSEPNLTLLKKRLFEYGYKI